MFHCAVEQVAIYCHACAKYFNRQQNRMRKELKNIQHRKVQPTISVPNMMPSETNLLSLYMIHILQFLASI